MSKMKVLKTRNGLKLFKAQIGDYCVQTDPDTAWIDIFRGKDAAQQADEHARKIFKKVKHLTIFKFVGWWPVEFKSHEGRRRMRDLK